MNKLILSTLFIFASILISSCSKQDVDIEKTPVHVVKKKQTATELKDSLKSGSISQTRYEFLATNIDGNFNHAQFWKLMRKENMAENYNNWIPYISKLAPNCSSKELRVKNKAWINEFVNYFSELTKNIVTKGLKTRRGHITEYSDLLLNTIKSCYRQDSGHEITSLTQQNFKKINSFVYSQIIKTNIEDDLDQEEAQTNKLSFNYEFNLLQKFWALPPSSNPTLGVSNYISSENNHWLRLIKLFKIHNESNGKTNLLPVIRLLTANDYSSHLKQVYSSHTIIKELVFNSNEEADFQNIKHILEKDNGDIISTFFDFSVENLETGHINIRSNIAKLISKNCSSFSETKKEQGRKLLSNLNFSTIKKLNNLVKKLQDFDTEEELGTDSNTSSFFKYYNSFELFNKSCSNDAVLTLLDNHTKNDKNVVFNYSNFLKILTTNERFTTIVLDLFPDYYEKTPIDQKAPVNVILPRFSMIDYSKLPLEFKIYLSTLDKDSILDSENREAIENLLLTTDENNQTQINIDFYSNLVRKNDNIDLNTFIENFEIIISADSGSFFENYLLRDLNKINISKNVLDLLYSHNEKESIKKAFSDSILKDKNEAFMAYIIEQNKIKDYIEEVNILQYPKFFKALSKKLEGRISNEKLFDDIFTKTALEKIYTTLSDSGSYPTKELIDILFSFPKDEGIYTKLKKGLLLNLSLAAPSFLEIIKKTNNPANSFNFVFANKEKINVSAEEFITLLNNVTKDQIFIESSSIKNILKVTNNNWDKIDSDIFEGSSDKFTRIKRLKLYSQFINLNESSIEGFDMSSLIDDSIENYKARKSIKEFLARRLEVQNYDLRTYLLDDENYTQALKIQKKLYKNFCDPLNNFLFKKKELRKANIDKDYNVGCFKDTQNVARDINENDIVASPFLLIKTDGQELDLANANLYKKAIFDFSSERPDSTNNQSLNLLSNNSLIKNATITGDTLNLTRDLPTKIAYPFVYSNNKDEDACFRWAVKLPETNTTVVELVNNYKEHLSFSTTDSLDSESLTNLKIEFKINQIKVNGKQYNQNINTDFYFYDDLKDNIAFNRSCDDGSLNSIKDFIKKNMYNGRDLKNAKKHMNQIDARIPGLSYDSIYTSYITNDQTLNFKNSQDVFSHTIPTEFFDFETLDPIDNNQ